MKWLAASLIVLACSAGCHAPKPSLNPFAAYGSSRVPPPATNNTARSTPYYNQPGGAAAGSAPAPTTNPTSGENSDAPSSLSNPSLTSSQDIWKSVAIRSAQAANESGSPAANGVELASFNSPTSTVQSSAAAPALFVPDAGSSPVASLPPPPTTVPANTVVATARASDSKQRAASSGAEGKPTLQWKTR